MLLLHQLYCFALVIFTSIHAYFHTSRIVWLANAHTAAQSAPISWLCKEVCAWAKIPYGFLALFTRVLNAADYVFLLLPYQVLTMDSIDLPSL